MSRIHLRTPRRLLATVGAAGILVLAAAGTAAAHVTVSSPDAAPGGFGKVVVRVPTESEKASTVKVEVTLPADTPFAFVSTKPHPGWAVATTEHTLDKPIKAEGFTLTRAVSTVTWTAQPGQGIKPGQFDEFELSVGPFPKAAGTLSMPAVQSYDDGTVVRWDQPTVAGRAEPEHPAPQLRLAAATQSSGSTQDASATTTATKTAASSSDAPDTTARWLGVAGVVLAAAALLIALLGLRRRAA